MPATLSRSLLSGVIALVLAATALAQTTSQKLTSPKEHFGHEIGADYVLPDYTQFMAYWQKLAGESDRMVLDTIGLTAEGRPQLMAIVTSPANHQRLARYKEIARRLALAEGVTDEEARRRPRSARRLSASQRTRKTEHRARSPARPACRCRSCWPCRRWRRCGRPRPRPRRLRRGSSDAPPCCR